MLKHDLLSLEFQLFLLDILMLLQYSLLLQPVIIVDIELHVRLRKISYEVGVFARIVVRGERCAHATLHLLSVWSLGVTKLHRAMDIMAKLSCNRRFLGSPICLVLYFDHVAAWHRGSFGFDVSVVSFAGWRCSVTECSSWYLLLFTRITVFRPKVSFSPHIVWVKVEIAGLTLSSTSDSCAWSFSLD